ncbi:uncharacterized protein LOC143289713 [Babylonia areolata]|uniref:uncharacterized protein LOC143289713 n=1 Tax=Babylonia areolata TaxID=304850 RepID=UPI003FD3A070
MEEELKTTKKTIRSLLISVKDGLSVAELEQDFIEFEGRKLPFAQFGFQNARAFLQSLTDVVQFFRTQNGEEKMKQVSDESTIHIEKLVARQKSAPQKRKSNKKPLTRQNLQSYSNRGKRGGGGNTRGGRVPQRGYPRPFASPSNAQPAGRPLLSLLGPEPRHSRQPLFPLPPQQQSSVGSRAQSGVAPYMSVADAAYENFHQTDSNCTSSEIIKVQKILDSDQCTSNNVETGKSGQWSTSGRGQGQKGVLRGRGKRRGGGGVQRQTSGSGFHDSTQPGLAANDQYMDFHSQHDSDSDWTSQAHEKPNDCVHFSSEDDCSINKGVQDKVRQVLSRAPKGLWAKRLPVMYKQMFHQDLPMKEHGFHSVIEFVSEMPHLVRIERPYENGDWLLSDVSVPREDPGELTSRSQQMAAQIARQKVTAPPRSGSSASEKPFRSLEQFKESVRQVLQHHVEGVMLHQFTQVYQEMTGRLLDPQAYGQPDMVSLLFFLAEQDVLVLKYNGKESTRLVGVHKPGLDIRRFDLLKDEYKPHPHHAVQVKQQSVPPGVVGPGLCYPPAALKGMEKGGGCEVHVSNVVSPNLFWVQNRSTIGCLDDLMDCLEEEYSVNAAKYRMPPHLMVHGQVCAALYEDDNWHRAIITGTSQGKVLVYYVDYGNSVPVDPATICFLMENFLSLPVQAMQAKLAYLLPLEGQTSFSQAAKDTLFQMVVQRPLHALISDIENLVLSLVLVDTSQTADVCINDELVDKGLARFIPDNVTIQGAANGTGGATSSHQSASSPRSPTPFYGEGRRYVRLLEFSPEIEFHVVYLGGEVLVLSSQISCLFWEEDCLAYMLQQQQVVLPKVVMSHQQCPTLFQELSRRGAFFVDEEVKLLNLYHLEHVPVLLDLFGDLSQKAEDLKKFIGRYLDTFDHHDPYWKGMEEEAVSGETSESTGTGEEGEVDPEDILTLEELQLALHSMQINRKRILRRMTVEQDCMTDAVKELESTEDSILQIQELIRALEQSNSTDVKLTGSGKSLPSPAADPATQTVAPEQQVPSSGWDQSPAPDMRSSSLRTNVVTPMVQPAQAPLPPATHNMAMPPPAAHSRGPSVTDLLPESVDLLAANQRLMEEIQQKDQIISSMLGGGGRGVGGLPWLGLGSLQPLLAQPAVQNPAPSEATPTMPHHPHNPGQNGKALLPASHSAPSLGNTSQLALGRGQGLGQSASSRSLSTQLETAREGGDKLCNNTDLAMSQGVSGGLSPQQSEDGVSDPQDGPWPSAMRHGKDGDASHSKVEVVTALDGGEGREGRGGAQCAVSTKAGPLPSPAVGVVRPHAFLPPPPPTFVMSLPPPVSVYPPSQPPPVSVYPTSRPSPVSVYPTSQPPPVSVYPTSQPPPVSMYPVRQHPPSGVYPPVQPPPTVPAPRPQLGAALFQASREVTGPRLPSPPTTLQRQLVQLQQKQMALYRFQAMMPPHLASPHLPPPVLPLPAGSGGGGDGGERGLLPGMVPLLHSFQESCSLQPSAPHTPPSSSQ